MHALQSRTSAAEVAHPPAGISSPPAGGVVDRMAEFMREHIAAAGSVTFDDLAGAGFTAAEIIEHAYTAAYHAELRMNRRDDGLDRIDGIIVKVRSANPDAMPLTAGATDSPTMRSEWRAYCRAVAAYRVDPWSFQLRRVEERLDQFLRRLPLLKSERQKAARAAVNELAKGKAAR
ncbi:hypothetical protein [Oricola thermophila]|uniref:Uncharacterized protein n=1 Tax=Oricola thermophila TaxID=2742145 RepID=A0A6N1VMQ6_9HYPH|nr:hypothetical protein [Oricola thermophila]QKV20267.1 hypothetical protein HTY61_18310 [Oricola thermophila]